MKVDQPTGNENEGQDEAGRPRWRLVKNGLSITRVSQVGLFLLVLGYFFHQTKPVLFPIVLAVLVSLVLKPVYLLFRKIRLPAFAAALLTVSGLLALIIFGVYQAALPGAAWLEKVDREQVVSRVQEVFRPVKEVKAGIQEIAEQVDEVTTEGAEDPDPAEADGDNQDLSEKSEEIVVRDNSESLSRDKEALLTTRGAVTQKTGKNKPGGDPVLVEIRENRVSALISETQEFGVLLIAFLLLVLFILAYGNRMARALSKDPTLESLLPRMGDEVSRYLFTITFINACLGLVIGLAMWALAMPMPILWGVLAMILNFIPYVGGIAGAIAVFFVAVASFDSPALAITPSLVYVAMTAIEGNIITPLVLGGRFKLNPLIVFVWIFAWAGFWGIGGMLVAMPTLVILKIACENTATMERFRRVLSS
ncbi:AI-2E family transporter [Haloferula chungangensis]|uniref:AI-2E family transporter n=1 Tax=Haloferula chungangensis TaxID=1048331 RepID=A0ABW2L373_9BACT